MKVEIRVVVWTFLLCLRACLGFSDVNVHDFGAAGDGSTDNTKAFQAALNEAGKIGTVVHVPAGNYRFDGTLTIPTSVTLKGVFEGPHWPDNKRGTVLLIYAGRDNVDSDPFITLNLNSTVKGLTLYYPEQRLSDVRPYPWTIQQKGGRANMIDLLIANTYMGIDCGTFTGTGHHLRNIDMCALKKGVYIDRCFDIGRVENVHIHPASWILSEGETSSDLHEYMLENLEGFIVGRTDWEYMVNCFVILSKYGFHFIETPLRPGEKRGIVDGGNMLITQSGSDLGTHAVFVDKVQYHAGIAFENCQFFPGFLINEGNKGPIKITNCGFFGVPTEENTILNKGTGALFITSCHFSSFDDPRFRPDVRFNEKWPLIKMLNGALHMTACRFQDKDHFRATGRDYNPEYHIHLGENVTSAVIMGNSVQGGDLRIDNKSKGNVQIIGN